MLLYVSLLIQFCFAFQEKYQLIDARLSNGTRFDSLMNSLEKPLILELKDNNFYVSGSCNSISGTYEIKGGRIVTDHVRMTLMACSDALSAVDWYVMDMADSQPYFIEDDTGLVLINKDVSVTLIKVDKLVTEQQFEVLTRFHLLAEVRDNKLKHLFHVIFDASNNNEYSLGPEMPIQADLNTNAVDGNYIYSCIPNGINVVCKSLVAFVRT